jgi:hypothetical protein
LIFEVFTYSFKFLTSFFVLRLDFLHEHDEQGLYIDIDDDINRGRKKMKDVKIREIEDLEEIEKEFKGRRRNSWDFAFEEYERSEKGVVVDGLTTGQVSSLYRAAINRGIPCKTHYPKDRKNGMDGKVALIKKGE